MAIRAVRKYRNFEARNQPLMPHLYARWLEEGLFAIAPLGLIIFGVIDNKPFAIAVGILLLGSIVAQARWAALRVRRGKNP